MSRGNAPLRAPDSRLQSYSHLAATLRPSAAPSLMTRPYLLQATKRRAERHGLWLRQLSRCSGRGEGASAGASGGRAEIPLSSWRGGGPAPPLTQENRGPQPAPPAPPPPRRPPQPKQPPATARPPPPPHPPTLQHPGQR